MAKPLNQLYTLETNLTANDKSQGKSDHEKLLKFIHTRTYFVNYTTVGLCLNFRLI